VRNSGCENARGTWEGSDWRKEENGKFLGNPVGEKFRDSEDSEKYGGGVGSRVFVYNQSRINIFLNDNNFRIFLMFAKASIKLFTTFVTVNKTNLIKNN
jgi:hypothetical protein